VNILVLFKIYAITDWKITVIILKTDKRISSHWQISVQNQFLNCMHK